MSVPETCMSCSHHEVVSDPDPTDWFCDDDMAVLCKKTPNTTKDAAWKSGELWTHRPATTSCRPYHLKVETSPPPKWCPLRK